METKYNWRVSNSKVFYYSTPYRAFNRALAERRVMLKDERCRVREITVNIGNRTVILPGCNSPIRDLLRDLWHSDEISLRAYRAMLVHGVTLDDIEYDFCNGELLKWAGVGRKTGKEIYELLQEYTGEISRLERAWYKYYADMWD